MYELILSGPFNSKRTGGCKKRQHAPNRRFNCDELGSGKRQS
jgi:hypothetical protein